MRTHAVPRDPRVAPRVPEFLPLESRTLLSGGLLELQALPVNAYSVATADFDNDGDIDVAAAYRDYGTDGLYLNILRNDGAGTLSVWQSYTVTPTAGVPINMNIADFDNDGDPDVVAFGLRLFRNTGNGVLSDPEVLSSEVPYGVYFLADENADHLPDIFVRHQDGSSSFTLHRNMGGSAVQPGETISTPDPLNFIVIAVVDMNADLYPDIVLSSSSAFLIMQSDGAGVYTPRPTYAAQSFSHEWFRNVVDVNADSHPDIVWGSDAVHVALNQGDGAFAPSTSSSAGWQGVRALADFNADGMLDVLGFTRLGTRATVSYATAPGVFSGQLRPFAPVPSGGSILFAAELNGDGCADALVVRQTDIQNGTLTSYAAAPGAEVVAFVAPDEPVIPGRLVSFSLATQPGAGGDVTGVSIHLDSNADGIFDPLFDHLIASASSAAPGMWTASWFFVDSIATGSVLLFAVPTDASGLIGDAASTPVTLWTRVFYPEGWRNDATINEYVPIVNPNPFPVEYRLVAHYETGERDQIVAQGSVAALTRGGVTISEHANPDGALVRLNVGYALELQSSAFLGAMLSHYDSFTGVNGIGAATGEALTNQSESAWYFAQASTADAAFLVLFNPFDRAVTLNITFYDDIRSFVTFQRTIEPLRRSGVALRDPSLALLPGTPHAIVVSSSDPILAALTSYSLSDGSGFTALGRPLQPAGWTDFPLPELRSSAENRLTLVNLSLTEVDTVTVHLRDEGAAAPIIRSYEVGPLERRVVDIGELPPGRVAVTVRVSAAFSYGFVELVDDARGDSVAASPAASAFTVWAFADGFLDRNTAGTVGFESIALFNPSMTSSSVQVRFLFTDGTFADRMLNLGDGSTMRLQLDQEQAILDHAQLNFYSIMIYSNTPIVAAMTHWDLFQGGGWTTLGTPGGAPGPA